MNKFASALAAVLLLAAPAMAAPPPLPVAISFLPEPGAPASQTVEAEAVKEALIGQGWFGRTASTLDPAAVSACAGKGEACVRALTHPTRGKTAPEVVVLMTPEAGKTRLTCIGPGEAWNNAERQTALVDLALAAAADPNPGRDDRRAAAGCIIAAAAESGW